MKTPELGQNNIGDALGRDGYTLIAVAAAAGLVTRFGSVTRPTLLLAGGAALTVIAYEATVPNLFGRAPGGRLGEPFGPVATTLLFGLIAAVITPVCIRVGLTFWVGPTGQRLHDELLDDD